MYKRLFCFEKDTINALVIILFLLNEEEEEEEEAIKLIFLKRQSQKRLLLFQRKDGWWFSFFFWAFWRVHEIYPQLLFEEGVSIAHGSTLKKRFLTTKISTQKAGQKKESDNDGKGKRRGNAL